jgi:PAS domain S-box-containing protein
MSKAKLTAKEKHPIFPVEEQFRLMANAAPILLWVSGTDNQCSFFNKAWLKFTGRTLSEESGEGWLSGVHPDDVEKCTKIYKDSFARQKEFKMEYRLRRRDGRYRWILDNGIPNFTKDKKFSGFIGSCIDIHELKEIENRKDQFITAAHHELRTPLTSLGIYLHMLREHFMDSQDEKHGSYVSGALGQVSKITALINQLLDLSHIQSGSLNFDRSVFPFDKFVRSVVKKMQIIIPSHQLNVKGKTQQLIEGDPGRLGQALENLLTNAAKYSKEHEKITIELSEDTKYVRTSVIDFGLQINKDDLPRIFDRFYRISGAKEETFPGLGIGLYISRKIITKHGGKISAESVREGETRFTFQIPIYKKGSKFT